MRDDREAGARIREQSRRNALARNRALAEFAKGHEEKIRELARKHRALIDEERGPLPGD